MNDLKCNCHSSRSNHNCSCSHSVISTLDSTSNHDCVVINHIEKEFRKNIFNINKLIQNLTKRIKKIEEDSNLRALVGPLNKHYEQSRYSKRTS